MELHAKKMGAGPALVILHGVFGSGDNWATLGRKWSEEYEVHLPDMRNHGKSPHSDVFSYEAMSDDLREYLDACSIKKARIIGHSMGGKIAMQFAADHPERVEKLLVADIAPRPYEPHHQQILEALQDLDLEGMDSRKEAEEAFGAKLKDEGTRQFLLKSLYWKENKKLGWRFNVEVIAREITKVGEGLPPQAVFSGETLFIRGGRSWYIQEKDEEDIRKHFPNAEIKTLAGAGHWLHAEKPAEFFKIANDFLRSPDR